MPLTGYSGMKSLLQRFWLHYSTLSDGQDAMADAAFEEQRFLVHRLFVSERDQRKIGGHPVLTPVLTLLPIPRKRMRRLASENRV